LKISPESTDVLQAALKMSGLSLHGQTDIILMFTPGQLGRGMSWLGTIPAALQLRLLYTLTPASPGRCLPMIAECRSDLSSEAVAGLHF
jgi:hypothetical protein